MSAKEAFLSLLEEYKKRFPKGYRFCPKKKASVQLKKFHRLECWECPHFIMQQGPLATCDPL
jgi:hypothetical protein